MSDQETGGLKRNRNQMEKGTVKEEDRADRQGSIGDRKDHRGM